MSAGVAGGFGGGGGGSPEAAFQRVTRPFCSSADEAIVTNRGAVFTRVDRPPETTNDGSWGDTAACFSRVERPPVGAGLGYGDTAACFRRVPDPQYDYDNRRLDVLRRESWRETGQVATDPLPPTVGGVFASVPDHDRANRLAQSWSANSRLATSAQFDLIDNTLYSDRRGSPGETSVRLPPDGAEGRQGSDHSRGEDDRDSHPYALQPNPITAAASSSQHANMEDVIIPTKAPKGVMAEPFKDQVIFYLF